MKKLITKILLASIILLGFGNINQTNAENLGGFENLFLDINNEFSCDNINYDIKRYYSSYKYKVDNLFKKISKKDSGLQKNIYGNLSKKTSVFIKKTNKNKYKKKYIIIGYIKCESDKKLDELKKVNLEKKGCNIGSEWKYGFMYSGTSLQKNDYRNAYYKINCDKYGKIKMINFERCENGYEIASKKDYIFGQKVKYCIKKKIGKKCYGEGKYWSDYKVYNTVGFYKLSLYSPKYNSKMWASVECKENGKWGKPKFLYCDKKGYNLGYDSYNSGVCVPNNLVTYKIYEDGSLSYGLNGNNFDFSLKKDEKVIDVIIKGKLLLIKSSRFDGERLSLVYFEKNKSNSIDFEKGKILGNYIYENIDNKKISYFNILTFNSYNYEYNKQGYSLIKLEENSNGIGINLTLSKGGKNIVKYISFIDGSVKDASEYSYLYGFNKNTNKYYIEFLLNGKITKRIEYKEKISNIDFINYRYLGYKSDYIYYLYSFKNKKIVFSGIYDHLYFLNENKDLIIFKNIPYDSESYMKMYNTYLDKKIENIPRGFELKKDSFYKKNDKLYFKLSKNSYNIITYYYYYDINKGKLYYLDNLKWVYTKNYIKN